MFQTDENCSCSVCVSVCFGLFFGCFGLFMLLRLCKLFSVVLSSSCLDILLDALDSLGCVGFCRWV